MARRRPHAPGHNRSVTTNASTGRSKTLSSRSWRVRVLEPDIGPPNLSEDGRQRLRYARMEAERFSLSDRPDLERRRARPHVAHAQAGPQAGAPTSQNKRSVVAIELANVDQWLTGTLEEASALIRLPPNELFDAAPAQRVGAA